MCQGVYSSPHQPSPYLRVRLLAAKVLGMTLAGLWEQCRQQSLVLCPTVSSPDWAGRPRSQGMQGRAKPTYLTALLCAEPSPSWQLQTVQSGAFLSWEW